MATMPIIKLKNKIKTSPSVNTKDKASSCDTGQKTRQSRVTKAKSPQERYREIKHVISSFERKYGDLFNRTNPKKALKVRIELDLFDDNIELSKNIIRKALYFYCSGKKYLQCIIKTDTRYGLDNAPAQAITDKEKDFSREKLKL
jgi:sRNA-binding protein